LKEGSKSWVRASRAGVERGFSAQTLASYTGSMGFGGMGKKDKKEEKRKKEESESEEEEASEESSEEEAPPPKKGAAKKGKAAEPPKKKAKKVPARACRVCTPCALGLWSNALQRFGRVCVTASSAS
jgi:hypothetical protein